MFSKTATNALTRDEHGEAVVIRMSERLDVPARNHKTAVERCVDPDGQFRPVAGSGEATGTEISARSFSSTNPFTH